MAYENSQSIYILVHCVNYTLLMFDEQKKNLYSKPLYPLVSSNQGILLSSSTVPISLIVFP